MSDNELPYFTRREHSYAELVSAIDWTERFVEEGVKSKNRKWLEKGLTQFLIKEKMIESNEAKERADKIIESGGMRFKKLVKNAEKKGFLEEYRLNEPWHPKTFYEEDFVSYPFQHASVIVYRGMRRKFFYKSNVQEEDERSRKHPTSIFNHQYLRPGSSLQQGDEQDFIWTTASLQEAKGYGSIVLEIQIPVKWLVFGAKRKEEVSSLQRMHEKFGSPKEFHSYLTDNWSSSKTTFKINRELPIHYVRGGWDLDKHDEPKFFPIYSEDEKDLIDVMREVDGDKIPENPSISRNWKESDEIVKQRKNIERALQHKYKIDEKEMEDLLDKVKAGEKFTYSDYLSFFRQLEEVSDQIKDDLESIRNADDSTDKDWIQSTLFSVNKVIEKLKKDFNQEYYVSQVEDGEELLKKVNRREKLLESQEREIKKFESNLKERREELRDIYNEELTRKDKTPNSIDLDLDTGSVEKILEKTDVERSEIDSFEEMASNSTGADITEKEEEIIGDEIKVEDEKINRMREKYEEDELVDGDELREEAERLKEETVRMNEVGSKILKIEKGEINAKEAFEEVDDKRVNKRFHEEVEETRELVKIFNQELERIKKEAAVLNKISSIQSIHPGGSLTRVNVMMSKIEENLDKIYNEENRINQLSKKI